jgi:hypothetical protein
MEVTNVFSVLGDLVDAYERTFKSDPSPNLFMARYMQHSATNNAEGRLYRIEKPLEFTTSPSKNMSFGIFNLENDPPTFQITIDDPFSNVVRDAIIGGKDVPGFNTSRIIRGQGAISNENSIRTMLEAFSSRKVNFTRDCSLDVKYERVFTPIRQVSGNTITLEFDIGVITDLLQRGFILHERFSCQICGFHDRQHCTSFSHRLFNNDARIKRITESFRILPISDSNFACLAITKAYYNEHIRGRKLAPLEARYNVKIAVIPIVKSNGIRLCITGAKALRDYILGRV